MVERLNQEVSMDIYLDENTGKYYTWDGSKFVEYTGQGQSTNAPSNGPRIGDKPQDDSDLADAEEHEQEVQRDAAEDGDRGDEQPGESEEQRIERVKKALDSQETKKGIESDNVRMSQRERQRQKEMARKAAQQAGGTAFSGGIKAFEKDLRDFMNNEVKEVEMATWSRQNRRYVDSPFIMQGSRYEDNLNIPSIGVYFDQSSSWNSQDVERGKNAIACLYELQKKNKIKFELKYFGNRISTDPNDVGGGTGAGYDLIMDIKNMKYDNVVVMTDADFDRWDQITQAPNIKVDGAVWFLWRNGEVSHRLQEHLRGKKRTRNYNI